MPPRPESGASKVSAEVTCSVFASDCVVCHSHKISCGHDPVSERGVQNSRRRPGQLPPPLQVLIKGHFTPVGRRLWCKGRPRGAFGLVLILQVGDGVCAMYSAPPCQLAHLTVSVLYLWYATLLLRVRCAHFNFFCLPCVVGSTCMNRRAQDQDVR
jgi:hypothetical protein